MRLMIRLTEEADSFIRATGSTYKKGLLSWRLLEALEGVDLEDVEVVGLRQQAVRTTNDQTALSIPAKDYKRLHDEARQRDCSVNALINAVIVRYQQRRGRKGWKDEQL